VEGDVGAAGGAAGLQPAEGLQEGEVLPELAGLQPPAGRQLTHGQGEGAATGGSDLQVPVELGDAQRAGGARWPLSLLNGVATQAVVGEREGLAVHREELQSHGLTQVREASKTFQIADPDWLWLCERGSVAC